MNRRQFLPRCLGAVALLPAVNSTAAAPSQLEQLLDAGQRLLQEHVDPSALAAIRSGDPSAIEGWLKQAMSVLQEDQVLELADLEDVAKAVLPILESQPRTRGYASWLKSRMDYFQVADFFRDRAPAPPVAPGQPAPGLPNPTPSQERKAWERQVASQPASKGAASWVSKLKPVFKQAGAPSELVWLAEIESSFDPQARSPAGAAGMYQLMPKTAEGLGLKLQPQDERLVPEKSARASATYLRQTYRQFKDWRLALAGYNAGPGKVADLLKRRRATSFDAVAPSLPAETQMYVPKLEAVLQQREKVALTSLRLPA